MVESINSWNSCIHSSRCSLEEKYLFLEIGSNGKETQTSGINFQYCHVSCRSLMKEQILHLSDFEMLSLEQTSTSAFLLEKSISETLKMIKKAYTYDAMKQKRPMYKWHKHIHEGCTTFRLD